MAKVCGYGLVVVMACALLAGCGGSSDDNARRDLAATQAELGDVQAELEAVQTEQEEQEDTEALETRIAKLTAAITALAAAQAADDVEAEEETTPTPATPAATPVPVPTPTPTPRPSTQNAEASQRALHLRDAFGATPTPSSPPSLTVSPVVNTVPTRGSLSLKLNGYSPATLGGSGLRSATMNLIRAGDPGKTVVYTDRELNRQLLDHYAPDSTVQTRLPFDPIANVDPVPALSTRMQINVADKNWQITHLFSTSVAMGTVVPPKMATFYNGSLHGVSGRFACDGNLCEVKLTPMYVLDTTTNRNVLDFVTVEATTSGSDLFFTPSTTPIALYEGGPVGADDAYLMFGYWREDPTSPAGAYQFETFAQVVGGSAIFPSVVDPVTYEGIAVGAYVEKDPNAAVDTYRQGEFTADVDLSATSLADITGTIGDFNTTPVGGSTAPKTSERWVLTLATGKTVELNQLVGTTTGAWNHAFVPEHLTGGTPPAVVGAFDARIEGLLTLVGAFGASKR